MVKVQEIVNVVESFADHHLLLFVGFDGVLVEYRDDPSTVRLEIAGSRLLTNFNRAPRCSLAVVSGRPVADLRARVGVENGVFWVGLHGLELQGPELIVRRQEMLGLYEDRLHEIAEMLQRSIADVRGVRVEDKGVAVAVHTRSAGSADAIWARLRTLRVANDLFRGDELRILRGNGVLELIPNVPGPRRTAIDAVLDVVEERDSPVLPIYIGEDTPDDDGFDAVEQRGITVAVGHRRAQAHYHLDSPREVGELIERVTVLKSPKRSN